MLLSKEPFFMSNPNWYTNNELGDIILTDEAPEEAKFSYEEYLRELDEYENAAYPAPNSSEEEIEENKAMTLLGVGE